jgi:hypothetical protein
MVVRKMRFWGTRKGECERNRYLSNRLLVGRRTFKGGLGCGWILASSKYSCLTDNHFTKLYKYSFYFSVSVQAATLGESCVRE